MEIIKRKTEAEIETVNTMGNTMQIAFNNFGHISLRFFDSYKDNGDVMVVLDSSESKALIEFIQRSLR